ncbi:uncharacterized protein BT62DRAFT_1008290 [Guyanagaster necrorhizus]|uniref:Uncharacterized protein n=1 Tax=Guyanagaster necrorhizus TaxID=856835 RepID=A0A9P7VNP3_9AGAR|nr:uncharacterized protein BT62DRAFT_1008290 [Guyanagaster necrorhizus MCA 3950]KAG7444084.1 hypothetical protein BT62DRAFT_1008290 [Guyanagaster necrorhizus MCA 3950]
MVVLRVVHTVLNIAYTSSEAQEDFPQYNNFTNLFKEPYFEKMLKKAVMGATTDVRPFRLEDWPTHGRAEDEVDWAPDRLKEENCADYDPPEKHVADNSGEYIPPRGTVTKLGV